MAYCPNCHHEIAENAGGCSACGAEFGADSELHPLPGVPHEIAREIVRDSEGHEVARRRIVGGWGISLLQGGGVRLSREPVPLNATDKGILTAMSLIWGGALLVLWLEQSWFLAIFCTGPTIWFAWWMVQLKRAAPPGPLGVFLFPARGRVRVRGIVAPGAKLVPHPRVPPIEAGAPVGSDRVYDLGAPIRLVIKRMEGYEQQLMRDANVPMKLVGAGRGDFFARLMAQGPRGSAALAVGTEAMMSRLCAELERSILASLDASHQEAVI